MDQDTTTPNTPPASFWAILSVLALFVMTSWGLGLLLAGWEGMFPPGGLSLKEWNAKNVAGIEASHRSRQQGASPVEGAQGRHPAPPARDEPVRPVTRPGRAGSSTATLPNLRGQWTLTLSWKESYWHNTLDIENADAPTGDGRPLSFTGMYYTWDNPWADDTRRKMRTFEIRGVFYPDSRQLRIWLPGDTEEMSGTVSPEGSRVFNGTWRSTLNGRQITGTWTAVRNP